MAKLTVGGSGGLVDQGLTLMGWAASSNTADPQRKQFTNALNLCDKMISQSEGLSYLRNRGAISLGAGVATAALPNSPAIDVGMDFTIEHPAGHGEISVVPPDRFAAAPASVPYDRIDLTPTVCMFAIDPADGVMKLFFRRVNSTGGVLSYPITYQQVVVNLIDNTVGAGSTSLLPEGYELTILLPAAEQFLKSRKTYPSVELLSGELRDSLTSFYSKYRTNKEKPTTDQNKERRKVEVDQLTPVAR